jgi:hypothetical protein
VRAQSPEGRFLLWLGAGLLALAAAFTFMTIGWLFLPAVLLLWVAGACAAIAGP